MVQISLQARKVWKHAVDNGVKFEVVVELSKLERSYRNLNVSEAKTLCEVESIQSEYDERIKRYEDEITQLVIFRTQFEQFLDALHECPVDETSIDLLTRCAKKLDEKLS